MKNYINAGVFLALVTVFAPESKALVTLTGTAASNMQNAAGDATVPDGALVLLVVDTGSNGFAGLTPDSVGPGASLALNASFGAADDLIFYRGVSSSGGFPPADAKAQINLPNFDASSYLSSDFALVWFPTLGSGDTETSALGGEAFGLVTDASWVLPATNTGLRTFGSEYASLGAPGAAGLNVSGIPEPSRVAFFAIAGLFGFLRRRR